MNRKVRAVLAAALLLAGCPADEPAAAPTAAAPIEVTATPLARRDVARELSLSVDFAPWQSVSIVAKVTGYLKDVPVDRGSVVKRDAVLATISVPELEDERRRRAADVNVIAAEISSAIAEHDLQAVTSKRFERLVGENAVSVQEWDVVRAREAVAAAQVAQAGARLSAAKEALRTTETWLAYSTVAAPFAGVVTDRWVHPGALVSAAERTPLFKIVDASTIRAVIDVPEIDSPRVKPGATVVKITIPELGRTIRATVSRSATAIEEKTRTLRVEVDLPNPDGTLLPGMFGKAAVVVAEQKDALAVPLEAVARDGEAALFVIEGGKVRRAKVALGLDDGKFVAVVSGVAEGAKVAGQARGLTDGAAVKERP